MGQPGKIPLCEDEAGMFEYELGGVNGNFGKGGGVIMVGAAVVDGIALGFGWNHFNAFCLGFFGIVFNLPFLFVCHTLC
jgi:hypothetical protein